MARRGSKIMTEQEARQILGVSEQSTWEEILQVKFLNNLVQLLCIFIHLSNIAWTRAEI